MNIVGLTGHSGSGKTTFAEMLSARGFHHIDCDKLVHEKIYTDPTVLAKFREVFGTDYVTENGVLDRKRLSKLVFTYDTAYKKLMETVKPFIVNAIAEITKQNKDKVILLDAPTLFEFGLEVICDKTVAVISSKAVDRICRRDGITKDDAERRLAHQKDKTFYESKCDHLIENNGDISYLEAKADEISNILLKGSDS